MIPFADLDSRQNATTCAVTCALTCAVTCAVTSAPCFGGRRAFNNQLRRERDVNEPLSFLEDRRGRAVLPAHLDHPVGAAAPNLDRARAVKRPGDQRVHRLRIVLARQLLDRDSTGEATVAANLDRSSKTTMAT